MKNWGEYLQKHDHVPSLSAVISSTIDSFVPAIDKLSNSTRKQKNVQRVWQIMQRNLNIFAVPSLNLWCHLSAPCLGHSQKVQEHSSIADVMG
jgi:hypothetical protein